jgi:Rps23 Pro-64 3,4-dihydroxylase Tpa1-like proline 4-hydroxylase
LSLVIERPETNIVYFKGVIKNYQEIIDAIESLSNDAVTDWRPWNGHGTSTRYGDIKDVRKDKIVDINSDKDRAKAAFAINCLTNKMSECAIEYSDIFNIDREALYYAVSLLTDPRTTMGINKYDEGAFMGSHVDFNEDNYYLAYTIVVYLNDDYEGGELYFNELDITIKPEAGSIIMYPSSAPYSHQSLKVLKGRKMLITHHWQMILPPNG